MTIGERIKLRRKELELTVDQIAEKLNKNRATIYRYESDEIESLPITIIEPLARALNTTPAWLMGWDDDYNKKYDDYSKYSVIYNFLNSYYNFIYSNLSKVLKEYYPDYPMDETFDYSNEFCEALSNTSESVIDEMFCQINYEILDKIKLKIYQDMEKSTKIITQDLINNTIQSYHKIICDKLFEVITNVLLNYTATEFVENINYEMGHKLYGNSVYQTLEKINDKLIGNINSSIQNILIKELFIDISFKIIENNFFGLNKEGRSKAYEYISDLSEQPKYKKEVLSEDNEMKQIECKLAVLKEEVSFLEQKKEKYKKEVLSKDKDNEMKQIDCELVVLKENLFLLEQEKEKYE